MRKNTQEKLLALNQSFYKEFATPFASSRVNPQPGFRRLLPYIPANCKRVLDVGCGEGRFGRFLLAHRPEIRYVGVDFSEDLLQRAQKTVPEGTFYCRDVSRAGPLQDLGSFGLVASLAVLQHIPGRENRIQLLKDMGQALTVDGRIFLSTWQFLDSERQQRKIVGWDQAGIAEEAVEVNDFLLTWGSGGYGVRYVAYVDREEVENLAQSAGLVVEFAFRSDGREGDLNLYSVLRRIRGKQSSTVGTLASS